MKEEKKNIYYYVEFHFWHDFFKFSIIFLVIHPRFVGPFICCRGTHIHITIRAVSVFFLLNMCGWRVYNVQKKTKTFLVWILIFDRSDTKINNFFFIFIKTNTKFYSLTGFFECPPSSLSYYVCLFTHIM